MKPHFSVLAYCAVLLILPLQALAHDPPESVARQKFGWIEKVRIQPGDLLVHAKLDTGADTCSLGATNVKTFKRDGLKWVRFKIRNRDGEARTIETPIIRKTRIKRINGLSQERLVVQFDVCLGDHRMKVDVNLVNRSNFSYRMLIGRNFLAGHGVVDPAATYASEPNCRGHGEQP